MYKISLLKSPLLSAAAGIVSGGLLHAVNGPDFTPPFEIKQGKRQDAQLVVQSFLDKKNGNKPAESASLVVGNKRVSVREFERKDMNTKRDNSVTVFINEKPVCSLLFAGGYKNKDKKWISFTQGYKIENVTFKADKAEKTITWSNSYQLPDGKKTSFSYKLKSLGSSRIELTWDLGCTEEQVKSYENQGTSIGNGLMYLSIPGIYRKNGITINDKIITAAPLNDLKKQEKKKITLWRGHLKKLVYNPSMPLNGFTLICESDLQGFYSEVFHYRRVDTSLQLWYKKPQGKMIIDLGETAVTKKDTPPPVEGNDLWKQDALHLPLSPSRNLFPNPSFEQGLRYWRWWSGGAHYTRSKVKRYEIDTKNGLFGKNALLINPTQSSSASPRSFSLPGRKGVTYTVSFYAKAEKPNARIKLAPFSSKDGGQFPRSATNKFKYDKLTQDWQRYSYSFKSDGTPVALIMSVSNNGGKVWLDGIQYEVGSKATEFVAAPLEGCLLTSDPDNNVEAGVKLKTEFAVSGKTGITGTADFTLMNFYKTPIWEKTLDIKAGESVKLPFDSLNLATGTYILRVKYNVKGTKPYYDFYRFSIIKSLDGTFATKDLYGALFSARDHRTEDRLDLMRRLGFGGSTSYGPGKICDPLLYELRDKYNVTGYTHTFSNAPQLTAEQKRDRHPDYIFCMNIDSRVWRRPDERKKIEEYEYYTPEILDRMEKTAEKLARECPYVRVWSIATEEEGTIPCLKKRNDFDEFAKLQLAFYRGIKRGNPKALVMPTGGTSGYGQTRGKSDIEGYLKATQGKVKWDAIPIHPYGSIDGTLGAGDLDDAIQMLSDSIAKFGYGKETPIYLNEGGGGSPAIWGDGPAYSYSGGQPSYDEGLHEFLHACKLARQYIICLKYWPRLPHFNTWQNGERTVMDMNLTPTAAMLGINTLGHLLANPKFIADIRPAAGMRGYAFKDDKGRGVAAVWCTIDDVENGFIRGPVMRVKFDGKLPEMYDLMGKSYQLKPEADGSVELQLTPAPLFLRGVDPQKLVNALKNAEVTGAGSNVKISFTPTLDGKIKAKIANLTGREQTGKIAFNGKEVNFKVAGKETESITIPGTKKPEFGKMFRWNTDYQLLQPKAAPMSLQWNMDYFYVPRVNGKPDWNKVPGIKMTNMFRPVRKLKQTPGGHPGDISATFKAAWDPNNFYLRVEAEDDIFNVNEKKFWTSSAAQESMLYMLDGCLEVYFDCGANGRLRKGGYDLDDYRYDFCVGNPEGKSGPGKVYRLREVFNEFAGGVGFPTKQEAAKGIKCEFTRVSPQKYIYEITFARKYVAPLVLKKGSIAGFALYLHDRMDDGTFGAKGLSLATKAGSHCDFNAQLWPLMILSDEKE